MSHKKENPNSNCLSGMACPKCGDFGPFNIHVVQSGMTRVSDDGTDVIEGNVEWADDSRCACLECGFVSTVIDFRQFEELQKIVLDAYCDGKFVNCLPSHIPYCADPLLKYLMVELSEAQGCASPEEAVDRLIAAIEDLSKLRKAFEAVCPITSE